MSVNRFAQPRFRLPLVCAGAMTLATLGFGIASAKAAPTLVDEPMPMPAQLSTPTMTDIPGVGAAGLGAPGIGVPGVGVPGLPGAAAGGPTAGVNAANSFLQALNGMLNRVVPGVGSIMPNDVSALTPPGAPMSGGPALEAPPAPAAPAAPAIVPQTLAGARSFSVH